MEDNSLGKRLKLLRNRAGLTQTEFGKHFNLAKSTISQYESGKSRPDDELKKKIADYYNVSLDWLMGRIEENERYGISQIKDGLGQYVEPMMDKEEQKVLIQFRNLSKKSKKDLFEYIELLEIRDQYKAMD